MSSAEATESGAYGFRLTGIVSPGLAVQGARDWPELRLEQHAGPLTDVGAPVIGVHAASLPIPDGRITIDRAASVVAVWSPTRLSDAEIVHPGLWPAAAVWARWQGYETLHAGAFVPSGGQEAWLLMGPSGAGKSTMLASLACEGHEILADDLVVLAHGDCFAGPRNIDLKLEAAASLGLETRTELVRATSRRRLALAPSHGRIRIAGSVTLDWGRDISVCERAPHEAFAQLCAHRRVRELGADYVQLLEIAGLPCLTVRRPCDWAYTQRAANVLAAHITRRT